MTAKIMQKSIISEGNNKRTKGTTWKKKQQREKKEHNKQPETDPTLEQKQKAQQNHLQICLCTMGIYQSLIERIASMATDKITMGLEAKPEALFPQYWLKSR